MSDESPFVLVVDDDQALRSLLQRGLGGLGHDVECVESGRAALRAVVRRRPDLVILDLTMPDVDGMDVCRMLRRIDPGLPILMLTARDTERDEVAGLAAGADDYMSKPFSLQVLDARVRALMRRQESQSDVLTYRDLRMDVAARRVFRGAAEVRLTSTEFEVLRMLLEHAGRVLSKEQLLQGVWGYEFGGSENLVEVYVATLRKKLDTADEPRLIQTVRGAGYVLRSE